MRGFLLLLLASLPLSAQFGAHGSLVARYDDPEDLARAEQLYRQSCTACHGANAVGSSRGPALNTGRFRRAKTDTDIYAVIASGIAGTEMPASAYESPDLWRLVSYLRQLSVERAPEQVSGDASAGRALFAGKGGCLNCHTLGAEGRPMGPDLSEIGGLLSVGQLETALLEPDALVNPAYWRANATLRSGEKVSGFRLNEDTFSVQMRANGRLISLDKRKLASYDVIEASSMPSFRERLTAAERDDLLAYLVTLRARR